MKKVAKAILIALGVILAIGAVIVLGVNLYVQSAGTRARIERGLSEGLHTPVKIASVSFMPWYGVRISGIAREDPEAADGNTLDIEDISVRLRLWRLIRHDVVIKELTVDGLNLGWMQNQDGKWQVPPPPAAALPPPQPEGMEPPPAEQPQPRQAARPVTVEHARLRDASFTFYDKNHRPLAALTGVYVQALSPSDRQVEGTAAVKKVAIEDEFFITDWNGAFICTPGQFSLSSGSCTLPGGGNATGNLDVSLDRKNSPFMFDTRFSGVDLDRVLTDAGVTDVQASGIISGFVHLEGDSRDSATAKGTGRIVLENGVIANSPALESLGLLLRTDKFHALALQDAHADLHVDSGKVVLDELTLQSAALTLTGKGIMASDGSNVFILCRLAISADIARQIPDLLMQDFGKDESGARYVDFQIYGTINHLDSTLEKVLGKNMKKAEKTLGNFLKNLLPGNQPEPAPSPAAEPSPAQPSPVPPNP